MARRKRLWTWSLAALMAGSSLAGPAAAWKPRTHVYLAELARRDAVDDGKVTIYEVDHDSGKIVGELGRFEVNPSVLVALRKNPAQFRAGVVGPDAYPDMVTGQQLIHPGTNLGHPGDPSALELPSAPGTDAWLTHLWRAAYGRLTLVDLALPVTGGGVAQRRYHTAEGGKFQTPEIRAFVAGYLTHAAGDMFMHTFVNHYAGGDFALKPDPRNAVKHIVLEGYVGTRTPPTRGMNISINGVDDFIYIFMVAGRPGTILYDRLLQGEGASTSLPAIFSRLRADLQRDVDAYYRIRNSKSEPERSAYKLANGPIADFKEAWIKDIDRGLRAWPITSDYIARVAIYNEADSTSFSEAKYFASEYMLEHGLSMAGAPDVIVVPLNWILDIINALPSPFKYVLDQIKKELFEWMVKSATGKSPEQLSSYLKDPARHFDAVMNSPGGGHGGRTDHRTTLAAFNRDVLRIDDPSTVHPDRYFDHQEFAPAFNTIQMTKIAFLSEKGMNDLRAALRAKGAEAPAQLDKYESPMLGFLRSMDADNQWQPATGRPGSPLARGKAAAWRLLFKRQIGQTADWPDSARNAEEPKPTEVPGSPADDASFRPVDQWAVRLDEVTYDAAGGGKGRNVTIRATFRNDTDRALKFSTNDAETLLDNRSGARMSPKEVGFVHTSEESLPTWHYLPDSEIPRGGRISVRFTYEAGDAIRQRLIHLWTALGPRPAGNAPRKQVSFPVPPLNLDGTVGEQAKPAPPAAASDPTQLQALKAIEGDYVTNLGTLLTITVDGAQVKGRAVTRAVGKREREQLALTLTAAGDLQGTWRLEDGAYTTWSKAKLRFAPDNMSFAGKVETTSYEPPFDYLGERLKTGGKPAEGGFRETGYFALRVEAAGRPKGPGSPIEVALTARNTQGGRRGVQYNDDTFTLVGSDGREYRSDGNFYGKSGEERLNSTVWLMQDEQTAVTYLFPGVPAGVSPAKLTVRNREKPLGEFPLDKLPPTRPAAAAAAAEPGAAGQPLGLEGFTALLVSMTRGADGAWEAVVTFRNTGDKPLPFSLDLFRMTLVDADGDTRQATGDIYEPDGPVRRAIGRYPTLSPGGEFRVKLMFPESATMTPSRYRVQDATGKSAAGAIPAAMPPRPARP